MKITWLGLAVFAFLAGCAADPSGPTRPDKPECAKPDKEPIDGGLGGTGKTEDDPCTDQTLVAPAARRG